MARSRRREDSDPADLRSSAQGYRSRKDRTPEVRTRTSPSCPQWTTVAVPIQSAGRRLGAGSAAAERGRVVAREVVERPWVASCRLVHAVADRPRVARAVDVLVELDEAADRILGVARR